MKKILLLACTGIAICLVIQSCKKSTGIEKEQAPPPVKINVTGLFSITGNWSTLGIDSRAALKFAADDINTYLAAKKENFRLSVSFYDTKLEPNLAEQDFKTAVSAGTKFIIGPQSSAELAAIQPSVDSAQTIVISQGSTAGSLAIAGDAIFRYCPSDRVEGPAIANTMFKDGIQGLVAVGRDDAGNYGLITSTSASFTKLGGTVLSKTYYSTIVTDFSGVISVIKASVNQSIATYGVAHTGVYLASFDEGAMLMAMAEGDPVLRGVKWYGGDGIALSAILLANTTADEFAVKTSFFAPSFGLPESLKSQWQPIATRIKASTNIEPDAFALAAYDAMWVIAKTLEATNGKTANFTQLKTEFAKQSDNYTGVTGSTALDEYGDRASGTFDYWGIGKIDTGYVWKVVGKSD